MNHSQPPSNLKCATIFTCGGGADLGLQAAGLTPIWGIEIDPTVAGIYEVHFGHNPHQDLLTAEPADYELPDYLHLSPSCTNASGAKIGGGEQPIDIALADKCVDFIRYHQPRWISLENVGQYQGFEAFRRIKEAIEQLDYTLTVDIIDLALFGVPQNRTRLILRATRGNLWPLPLYFTHSSKPDLFTQPLASWWDALKDLVPEMPIDSLLPAQLEVAESQSAKPPFMIQRFRSGQGRWLLRKAHEQSWTIRASSGGNAGSTGNRSKVINIVDADGVVRTLSMRGLARITTFPDAYDLPDSLPWHKRWWLLGNAVPPLAMERIAKSLVCNSSA